MQRIGTLSFHQQRFRMSYVGVRWRLHLLPQRRNCHQWRYFIPQEPNRLRVEEDYAGFLGIEIKRYPDGTIELIQTGLIDRFFEAVELGHENTNPRLEPADKQPLGKDENGSPRREKWSYPSVIGMLLYLSSNSRPDISFCSQSMCTVWSLPTSLSWNSS